MYHRFWSIFSKPIEAIVRTRSAKTVYLEKLKDSGLESRFNPENLLKSQSSVKVFGIDHYINNTPQGYSFSRLLMNTAAISVAGDRMGYFQDGTPFPKDKMFFNTLTDGDPRGLSPNERLVAGKKIISSNSWAFARGGYPAPMLREYYKKPFQVGIYSQAGAQFEMPYLHYKLFALDPFNTDIDNPLFAHLYEGLPKNYTEAVQLLGAEDFNLQIGRIRDGFSYISRTAQGNFFTSIYKSRAIIFLDQAYTKHLDEDVALLLTAVDKSAAESGKPAFLKATALGMGYFSQIDCLYDIKHHLYSYFLQAIKKALESRAYLHIGRIEFPIFSELFGQFYQNLLPLPNYGGVIVQQRARDLLDFTEDERDRYYVCVINPSDANALPGNEWGDGSIEAALANNTSLRFDQVHLMNPRVLDPSVHISIDVNQDLVVTRASNENNTRLGL